MSYEIEHIRRLVKFGQNNPSGCSEILSTIEQELDNLERFQNEQSPEAPITSRDLKHGQWYVNSDDVIAVQYVDPDLMCYIDDEEGDRYEAAKEEEEHIISLAENAKLYRSTQRGYLGAVLKHFATT